MKNCILPLLCILMVSCNRDFDDYFDQELLEVVPENIDAVEKITKENPLYDYLGLVSQNELNELNASTGSKNAVSKPTPSQQLHEQNNAASKMAQLSVNLKMS